MGTPVEIRGRWPKKAGDPTGRVTLNPAVNVQGLSCTLSAGGVPLLQYTSENVDLPESLTLNFSLRLLNVAPSNSDHRVLARLRYGYGKSQTEAYVDIRHGTQVSLQASTVECDVIYFSLAGIGPRVEVSGAIAYGGGGFDAPQGSPTFTGGLGVVGIPPAVPAASVSGDTNLPPRARNITVYQDSGPQSFDVIFRQGGGGPAMVDLPAPGNRLLTIPNGAEVIGVRNNDAAAAHNYVFAYDLAL
jgi:hypothetical protein